MPAFITARGVRVHNLRGIDVSIPTRKLVVVTGVSGSGKSSLAFDTLYAEGQRRYVESLSAYARQFLERMEKPAVDAFDGVCPAIAIKQRITSRNPRSTVATSTEIHDHLRLLFARVGSTACDACGREVQRDSAESVASRLLALPEGQRLLVGFALPTGGTPRADFVDRLRRRGFTRLLLGEAAVDLTEVEGDGPPLSDPAVVVVDRLAVKEDARSRLVDSLETAFAEGAGQAEVQVVGGERLRFSERFECSACGRTFVEPQPRLFSFNNPFGACPTCHGFGNLIEVNLDLVIPDKDRSLSEGAVEPWSKPHYRGAQDDLRRFARRRGIPWDKPWSALENAQRQLVLDGDGDFPGILGFFRWLEGKKYKVQVRVFLSRYRGYQECPACHGARLREAALRVRVGGRRIDEVSSLSIREARDFFASLRLSETESKVAGRVLSEIARRLTYLSEVGLEYLTLDRPSGSLSGGESQRIALATSLGAGPGGHAVRPRRAVGRPAPAGHRPADRGSSRLFAIRATPCWWSSTTRRSCAPPTTWWTWDPGRASRAGRVVFQGAFQALLDDPRSLTGKYLRGDLRIAIPARRRRGNGLQLRVRGASEHNLKNVDVRIPLGAFTVVTGVSGSGKSTLVHDVRLRRASSAQGRSGTAAGGASLEGAEYIEDVVLVDQSPIGRTPRSNPVTYLKAFDPIRELFAATKDARSRGLTASHFSFNVPGGRCEACAGKARSASTCSSWPTSSLLCDACDGKRFRPQVLEVRYRGRTIDQVLDLTVREALMFFAGPPKVTRRLQVLDADRPGLPAPGPAATTLSGGEAQRIKMAAHLLERPGERLLYVLDEPTTGLHFDDIASC